MLCPNASLEAIAFHDPKTKNEIRELSELKGWFAREFGAEVTKLDRETTETPPTTQTES